MDKQTIILNHKKINKKIKKLSDLSDFDGENVNSPPSLKFKFFIPNHIKITDYNTKR